MSCSCFAKADSPPSARSRSGASASSVAEDSSSCCSISSTGTGGASSSSASSCEVSSSCAKKRRLYDVSSGAGARFLHKHKARRIACSRPVSLLPGRSFSLLYGTIPPENVEDQDNDVIGPYVAPPLPRGNEIEE